MRGKTQELAKASSWVFLFLFCTKLGKLEQILRAILSRCTKGKA
jgi:hypothetical protein